MPFWILLRGGGNVCVCVLLHELCDFMWGMFELYRVRVSVLVDVGIRDFSWGVVLELQGLRWKG